MKRILSLDGGGIRGLFSLEILLRIEELFRAHTGKPDLVLADCFDFFAGTSIGAIIATCLAWGMSVEKVTNLFLEQSPAMFQHVPWYRPAKRFLVNQYNAKPLSELLRRIFSEDDEGKVPALLGTKRLRTLLMVVIRNHTTGSAWPVTNNPKAKYNDPALNDCNLKIPLWKIVRASTAAPVFFEPEEIDLGGNPYVFVDGGITPYNNPALIAVLSAVLPGYRIDWEPGPDKIRMISVGTIRFTSGAFEKKGSDMWVGYHLPRLPSALIQGAQLEQDYLCRCLGDCLHGEELDSEIGDLVGAKLPGRDWFSYVRYNESFLGKAAQEMLAKDPDLFRLDSLRAVPLLRKMGREYAAEHVKLEHLI